MNNNMSNNDTAPIIDIGITQFELWLQLVVAYLILCGVCSSIGNFVIIRSIYKNKHMRTRFFMIVCYLSGCRLGLSLQLGVMAVYRIFRTLNVVSLYQTRFACNLVHFWLLHGMTLELMLIIFMVLDRAMAIVAGIRYRNLTNKQASHICLLIYGVNIVAKVLLVLLWGVASWEEVVPCVNAYSPTSEVMNEFTRYLDLFFVMLLLTTYGVLMGYIQCRLKAKQAKLTAAAKSTLDRQLALVPMLRQQVYLHCALAMSSKMLLFLSGYMPSHSERLVLFGGFMLGVDVFVNTVALMLGNKDLRNSCVGMLKFGKTIQAAKVITISINTNNLK